LVERVSADVAIGDVSVAPKTDANTRLGVPGILPSMISVPSGAAWIGPGLIFSQRTSAWEGRRFWDILDRNGELLQGELIPDTRLYPLAFSPADPPRIYVLAQKGGEPAIEIVRIVTCKVGG